LVRADSVEQARTRAVEVAQTVKPRA